MSSKKGKRQTGQARERRSGDDRRSGRDRRSGADSRESGGDIHDLYQADLDRHLWSFGSGKGRTRRKRSPVRRVARILGALGVAGLSYYVYRRWLGDEAETDEETKSDPSERAESTAEDEEAAGV